MEELKAKLDGFCKSLKEPIKKCREVGAHFETESLHGDIGSEKMQKLCSEYIETVTDAKTNLEKLVLQMDGYMILMREAKVRHRNDDRADSGYVKSTDSVVLDTEKWPVQETEQQQIAKKAVEHGDNSDSLRDDKNESMC